MATTLVRQPTDLTVVNATPLNNALSAGVSLQVAGGMARSGAGRITTPAGLYLVGFYGEVDLPAAGDILVTVTIVGTVSSNMARRNIYMNAADLTSYGRSNKLPIEVVNSVLLAATEDIDVRLTTDCSDTTNRKFIAATGFPTTPQLWPRLWVTQDQGGTTKPFNFPFSWRAVSNG